MILSTLNFSLKYANSAAERTTSSFSKMLRIYYFRLLSNRVSLLFMISIRNSLNYFDVFKTIFFQMKFAEYLLNAPISQQVRLMFMPACILTSKGKVFEF